MNFSTEMSEILLRSPRSISKFIFNCKMFCSGHFLVAVFFNKKFNDFFGHFICLIVQSLFCELSFSSSGCFLDFYLYFY